MRFPVKLIFWIGVVLLLLFVLALCPGVLHASNTFAAAAYGSPVGRADSTVVPVRENLTRHHLAGSNQSACGSLPIGGAQVRILLRESNTAADYPAHAAAPTAQFPSAH